MAYDRNDGFKRETFKGSWKCSKCDKEITELPFEPDPSRLDSLMCRDCHRESRANR